MEKINRFFDFIRINAPIQTIRIELIKYNPIFCCDIFLYVSKMAFAIHYASGREPIINTDFFEQMKRKYNLMDTSFLDNFYIDKIKN